jgi:hypothetical protein
MGMPSEQHDQILRNNGPEWVDRLHGETCRKGGGARSMKEFSYKVIIILEYRPRQVSLEE